jgi:hypothetical protein
MKRIGKSAAFSVVGSRTFLRGRSQKWAGLIFCTVTWPTHRLNEQAALGAMFWCTRAYIPETELFVALKGLTNFWLVEFEVSLEDHQPAAARFKINVCRSASAGAKYDSKDIWIQ